MFSDCSRDGRPIYCDTVISEQRRTAIRACAASHQALDASLVDLTNDEALRPSMLPGWSVAHDLTHIARNADGLGRLFDAALRGEVAAMYAGGREGRDADIAAGASRSATELVDDVHASSARLDARFAAVDPDDPVWSGRGSMIAGEISIGDLPVRRRGEVEIHRVDLGLGYGFSDWPADFLRSELNRQTGVWASRKPMGFADLPPAALALGPAARYAWLIGRLDVDGLAPAGIF